MEKAIKATIRKEVGTSISRKLRRSGFVPAVVYGQHSEPRNICLETKDVEKLLNHHGVGASITLDVEGENIMAMIKDVQMEVLKNKIVHMDLQELTKGEKVKITIPIRFINKEVVETATTLVVEQLHELDIEVLPKDLIESYDVDVSSLKDNPSIVLEDLDIFKDERFTLFHDADTSVASLVQGGAKETDETETEELLASEVPVIGEVNSEEE